MPTRLRHLLLFCVTTSVAIACILMPGEASAQDNGGSTYVPPPPPAKRAKIVSGVAIAPAGAPARVKSAIAAANLIVSKPYIYGGGHKPYAKVSTASGLPTMLDTGYDCSGGVSMALFGGKFLKSPLDSSSFMSWGMAGLGRWITVYTNPGHAYVVIAGLRFDTSAGDRAAPQERASGSGPRWRKYNRKPAGFSARHPKNF